MAVISSAPDEINNAFTNEGPQAPSHITLLINNCGSTVGMINGAKDRVNYWVNSQGAGVFISCPNSAGQGDCKSLAPGRRFTKSFMAGNADASQPTLIKMCTAEGTGVSFKGGGGEKATIQMATGDGKNGIMITEGYIALYTQQCYLVLDANRGVTFSNNFRVQEGPPDSPKAVNKRTFGLTDA